MITRIQTCALLCATAAVAVGCSARQSTHGVVPSGTAKHAATVLLQPPYDKAVLALSPYAYYRLDEVTGTVAYDSSGNNRNGTYEGTSGTHYLLGQAAVVPGFTHSVQLYSANPGAPKVALPSLNLGYDGSVWQSDFSVALWAEPDASQLAQINDMVEVNDYYVGQYDATAGTASTKAYVGDETYGNWSSPTTTFADGKAHFLVQTVHRNTDGSGCQVALYADGAQLLSVLESVHCGGASGIAYSTNAGIGGRVSYSAGVGGFFGRIGGVAIFSTALSASQISNLYDTATGATPTPSPTPAASYDAAVLALSPYAYYRLDDTSGTVAHDSSGNARDGTYKGTSGTHYLLGQASVVPGLTASVEVFAANPGAPKVALPSMTLGGNGVTWQSDFTVTLWAQPDASQLAQSSTMAEMNDYYVGQLDASTQAASTKPYMGDYTWANWSSPTTTFADGNAHFIAQTVHRPTDGSGCQVDLYVDGALVLNEVEPNHCGGGSIAYSTNAGIGGRVSYGAGVGGYFGRIGGVAFFPTALTAAQIAGMYVTNPQ